MYLLAVRGLFFKAETVAMLSALRVMATEIAEPWLDYDFKGN